MAWQRPLLLVVDDEAQVVDIVRRFAERAGFDVHGVCSGREALEFLHGRRADVALVDLHMPEIDGLDVLRAIREADPRCQTILITGYASISSAVEAVKLGAMDYLSKPLDFGRLSQLLLSVREDLERRSDLLEAEAELARRLEFHGMVGRSPAMQETFGLIRRLAPHLKTALVTGETGTGKELVARALHRAGPRHDKPFFVVDCTSTVETTFELELFGCVAGAVPGASEARPGLLEQADGGMVLLDEVSGLPLSVQARLLRLIGSGELRRLGSLDDRPVDLQVVAATNRDLRAEVGAGRFRSDLLYRLNVVEIPLPPLRERRGDIPYLTAAFIRAAADRLGKPLRGITTAAEAMLVSAPWDGNVRELRNVLERACLMADGEMVTEREVAASMPRSVLDDVRRGSRSAEDETHLLSSVEREHILRALQRAGGNKKAAARMLGVSRRALYRRLERLDLAETIARRPTPGRSLAGGEPAGEAGYASAESERAASVPGAR